MDSRRCDTRLQPSLHEFWENVSPVCRPGRGGRLAEIDLMTLPDYSRGTLVLDVDTAEGRFRVRFAGSRIVDLLDGDPTGRFADELDVGDARGHMIETYRRIAWTDEAHWIRMPASFRILGRADLPRREMVVEQLACPMRGVDGQFGHILAHWAPCEHGPEDTPFAAGPVEPPTVAAQVSVLTRLNPFRRKASKVATALFPGNPA